MEERVYSTPMGGIHYWVDRAGDGTRWLALLPGLTADHGLFERQLAYFHGKFNLFTWDAPAHGASRPFELQFTMLELARWLRGIFAREGIEHPIFIGQSMGGYIAQYYMDEFPGAASGFVSIDSCPLKRRYFMGWELWLLKRTKWMYLSIPWRLLIYWGSNGCATTEYGRAMMRRMMESYEKHEYCALADHGYCIVAEAVEEGRSFEISCPCLLICGMRDMAGSAKRYNRAWTREEGFPILWIPGAGHNSNADAPEAVDRAIEAFAAGGGFRAEM